jgi:biofilm PGA synthesis N-glycosyltransferase PgaC
MEIDRAILGHWIMIFNAIVLMYVFMVQTTYFSFLIVSLKALKKYIRINETREFVTLEQADYVPPISIIVPAYNEGLTIVDSIKGFLHIDYPRYEIIMVNDGSKDDTLIR